MMAHNDKCSILPRASLIGALALAASVGFATSQTTAREPAASVEVKPDAPSKNIRLKFPDNAPESPGVFQRVSAQKLVSDLPIQGADLISVYDAVKDPLKNRGVAEKLEGSFAPEALTGNQGILLWGPYVELKPGHYWVVYRLKVLEAATESTEKVFLDVCHNGCTRSGIRLEANQLTVGTWQEFAVPVLLTDRKELEFRFWPAGNKIALDQVFVFRVTPRESKLAKVNEAVEDLPLAIPVPGKTGVVKSPCLENSGSIDVSGLPSGTRVRCPYSGKYFKLP